MRKKYLRSELAGLPKAERAEIVAAMNAGRGPEITDNPTDDDPLSVAVAALAAPERRAAPKVQSDAPWVPLTLADQHPPGTKFRRIDGRFEPVPDEPPPPARRPDPVRDRRTDVQLVDRDRAVALEGGKAKRPGHAGTLDVDGVRVRRVYYRNELSGLSAAERGAVVVGMDRGLVEILGETAPMPEAG